MILCKIDIEENSKCKNCCKGCNSKCNEECIFSKRSSKCGAEVNKDEE